MKKIISLLITIIMLVCVFTSCANSENDLLTIARQFEEKDYWVDINIEDDDIQDWADEFEIRSKGIECVLFVTPDDGSDDYKAGIFIFFEDTQTANTAEKDIKEEIEKDDSFADYITRCIVKRDGTLVFVGSEYAWDDRK